MTAHQRAPRLTPAFRLGLFAAVLLACSLAGPGRWVGVGALSALVIAGALAARVSLRLLLLRLAPLVSFLLIAGGLLLLAPAPTGTPALRLPLLNHPVPRAGADFVLGLAIKSVLIVALTSAFARWVTERDFLAGLIGLRLPGKLASLLYLIVRSLRDVRDEALRLIRARDSRGKPRGLRALRTAAALSQVLLIRLGQRADLRAAALVSRGFANRFPLLNSPSPSWQEAACLLGCVGLLGFAVRM